jgi:transposase
MEWTVAIGVDTHKEMHAAVALDALGAQLDSQEIPTTPAGYRRLLSWAQELGVPAFAIEGTGSYGAGLARFLERAGVAVYECERPRRQERRRGKNDLVDAALAARRLVAGEGLSLPRGVVVDARTCACSCSSVAAPCRRATPPSTS